jgi:phenylacetate-CoA ligase
VELAESGACGCGRHHTALTGGIIGRVDDMVVVRGVNVYPSAIDEIVRRSGGVVEYQVKQTEDHSLAELTIRIEVAANESDPDKVSESLARELQRSLALRIPVEIVPNDSLPRFEMKAKRWIRG